MAEAIGMLVEVKPNDGGDTLTAFSNPDGGQNLGKLVRGAVYRTTHKAGGIAGTMYRLEVYNVPFPFGNKPDVWADADYLPPYNPVVQPPADPEPDLPGSIWMALVLEIGKAIVKVLG